MLKQAGALAVLRSIPGGTITPVEGFLWHAVLEEAPVWDARLQGARFTATKP